METLIITVSGGLVQSVHSTIPETNVHTIDYDDLDSDLTPEEETDLKNHYRKLETIRKNLHQNY